MLCCGVCVCLSLEWPTVFVHVCVKEALRPSYFDLFCLKVPQEHFNGGSSQDQAMRKSTGLQVGARRDRCGGAVQGDHSRS